MPQGVEHRHAAIGSAVKDVERAGYAVARVDIGQELAMDKETRKAIEEAGFRVTTVKEFLGLTEEENQLIELKVAIAMRVRKLREERRLTQDQLALLLRSSQSRVARIEAAHPSVTLDLMVRAVFALGGKFLPVSPPGAG